MSKVKIENSVWFVLGEGFKIYLKNFTQFTRYMLFPVFGQVIGISLIFYLSGWFGLNVPAWAEENLFFQNYNNIILTLLLITAPGFVLFLKAFWDFMVAYGALNSMANAVLTTGKLYDLDAHTKVITNRAPQFVGLLITISILALIGINPLFWIIGAIAFVYFILIFQVFTLEENPTVIDCFRKSFNLIKGDFARTFVILFILATITYYLLSIGTTVLLQAIRLHDVILMGIQGWTSTLQLDTINDTLISFKLQPLTPASLALETFKSSILCIVAGLSLPLRSICWTLWYKNLEIVKAEKPKKSKKG